MKFFYLIKKNNLLRKKINHTRKQLSYQQRYISCIKATNVVLNYLPIKKAKNIALFISSNGELNTNLLIYKLLKDNKKIYLPVLHPFSLNQLLFIRYEFFTKLKINQFNIPEPKLDIMNLIPLKLLDIIILPVLAFDDNGNRLGMGSGYYDRTLQNYKKHNFLLVGLAYDFQKFSKLEKNFFDIPLSIVITPSHIYKFF